MATGIAFGIQQREKRMSGLNGWILADMAERVGFEPTVLVKVHTLSKRAP